MVPALFKAARTYVMAQMLCAKGASVNFTSNIWTLQEVHNAHLLLTAHWWKCSNVLDGSGEASNRQGQGCLTGYSKTVLHVEPLNSAHKANNITATISEQIASWIGVGGYQGLIGDEWWLKHDHCS